MPLGKITQFPLVPDLTYTRKQTTSAASAVMWQLWVWSCETLSGDQQPSWRWRVLVLPMTGLWCSSCPMGVTVSTGLPQTAFLCPHLWVNMTSGVLCTCYFPILLNGLGSQVQIKHKFKNAFSQNYPEKTPLSNSVVSSAIILARISTSR